MFTYDADGTPWIQTSGTGVAHRPSRGEVGADAVSGQGSLL